MKKNLTLVFCILFSVLLFAQEKSTLDKITLKSGEVYLGKIILKNADVIMLTDKNGMRYQFQQTDVKLVELTTESEKVIQTTSDTETLALNTSFGAMVEVSAGFSKSVNCFNWSPNSQISLLFGNRKVLGKRLFLGLGTGYNSIFISSGNTMSFVPVFARVQGVFSANRTAPYVGMDAGYAVALKEGDKGGAFVRVTAGISKKISYKGVLFVGAYAGVQIFSTTLTEIFENNSYTYFSSASLSSLGVKVGLQF